MLQLKGQTHSWCKWNFQLVNCSISRIVWTGAYWVTKEKGASAEPSQSRGAELPKLPLGCCFFSFPSLLSSFRMSHLCSSTVLRWRKWEKSPLILIRVPAVASGVSGVLRKSLKFLLVDSPPQKCDRWVFCLLWPIAWFPFAIKSWVRSGSEKLGRRKGLVLPEPSGWGWHLQHSKF